MATAPLKISRQAGFKPHRLTGQEIVRSKARGQAEIYTSKTRMDGTTKVITSLEGMRLKSKNRKIPRESSLLKWQPNKSVENERRNRN